MHGKLSALAVFVLALLCPVMGRTTDTSDYGWWQKWENNVCLRVEITNLPETPTKVTGTNVNFGIAAVIHMAEGSYHEPWTSAVVQSVQLKVNGDDVNEPALPSPANYYSKAVRVDSTKYDHGGPFELEWKVTFLLTRTSPPETKTTTLTVVVEKEVHNLALLTRTTVESNNQVVEAPITYAGVAEEGQSDAISKYGSANRSVPSPLTHTESQFLSALANATDVFAFTHGHTDGIWTVTVTPETFMSWTDMAGAPLSSSVYPGRNLAIFYACSTNPESYAAPTALGMMASSSAVRENAGVLGFPFVVWARLKSNDSTLYLPLADLNDKLSLHSSALMTKLLGGETVETALAFANVQQPPRTPADNQDPPMKYMPLIAKADLSATFHKVYGGGPSPEAATDWYRVFDAPPIPGGPR